MKAIMEAGPWRVVSRINQAGNLTLEIELDGDPHAEIVLQENGVVDVGTVARPWPTGPKGWDMPGAPTAEMRKYRFGPPDDVPAEDP